MFARWRTVRADRRRWAEAQTLPELGELMALWLEGELSTWPGYAVAGPDEETIDLVAVLARANRGGFITDQSQPGVDKLGADGRRWVQRAAVSGLVRDERLLDQLMAAADRHGLTMLVSHADGPYRDAVTVTAVDDEPYTGFGAYMPRRTLHQIWPGVSSHVFADIAIAWQVTLIDPRWGEDSWLWPALGQALDARGAVA